MRRLNLYILVFTATSIVSCKKDKEIDKCSYAKTFIDITSTAAPESGMLPLNTKNFWVYNDTMWDQNGSITYYGSDTIAVFSVEITENEIWWNLKNFGKIHQAQSNIYILDSDFFTGCRYKRHDYFPVGNDTIEKRVLINGDQISTRIGVKYADTVNTPAGNFTDCNHYENRYLNSQVLKPGIGFIKLTWYYPGTKKKYLEKTLSSFHIQ